MAKRKYHRTAALLNAQPRPAAQRKTLRVGRANELWRPLLAVLLLSAVGLWLVLDARWYVDRTRLEVMGASLQTAREVALAGEVLGLHGLWLRPGEVVSRVQATVPVVTDVAVGCYPYPAQCVIAVRERQPVLAWQTEGGTYWVDGAGVVFAARDGRESLPLVRGALPGERVPEAVLEGVNALLALGLPRDKLRYHPQRGLTWTDAEGRRVALGTGREMGARLDAYRALIADLEARGIFPWGIDVRFPAAPTYAMEPVW
jgi:cell division septal protein FtsQ